MMPPLPMIDLSGSAVTADERAFLRDTPVSGVCLFARNVRDRHQLAEYTAELRALTRDALLVAIDQEGGGVVRVLDLPYPPSAMALGSADDLDLTRAVAAATARGLRAVGVNVDFAPVADVNVNPANPVIADRAFGSDARDVARHVVAFTRGLQDEGVAACAKHFPGHGDTTVDTHLDLSVVPHDRARLDAVELAPFRAAIDAGVASIMTFHGLVPALDPEHPATLSRAVMTGLLRDELGFDGVVFTDALDMRAIADQYGPADAAVRAVAAGVDVPLHTGPLHEHAKIARALESALGKGRLDPEAVRNATRRIARLAAAFPAASPAASPAEPAWRDGDDALLDDAAQRAVATLGTLPRIEAGTDVVLVAARSVATSAASQLVATPARDLALSLRETGVRVHETPYDPNDLEADRARILDAVRGAPVTLYASTARTRMPEHERSFAHDVARAARAFVHVALWNPYHVPDLPGPAVVTFGFRPRSCRAAARVLLGDEATGRPPVPLAVLAGAAARADD